MPFRVLVIDDYPDVPAAMCSLLEAFGHVCVGATTGLAGIELAQTFRPEIALVDLGLPDITGFEVARALRVQAGDRPLFLAAISGWNAPEDRVQAIAAGFDHHVLKPIDGGIARRVLQLAEARRFAAGSNHAQLAHSSRSR